MLILAVFITPVNSLIHAHLGSFHNPCVLSDGDLRISSEEFQTGVTKGDDFSRSPLLSSVPGPEGDADLGGDSL
jgi:hypothetical protein